MISVVYPQFSSQSLHLSSFVYRFSSSTSSRGVRAEICFWLPEYTHHLFRSILDLIYLCVSFGTCILKYFCWLYYIRITVKFKTRRAPSLQ